MPRLPGKGIGKLVDAGLVTRMIASHIGLNPESAAADDGGQMAIDLVPQGTLVERIRAGGCGLGGVLTPTGVGTTVEQGKQKIEVAERPICWRRRCTPTSRWFIRSWPTISAIFNTRSRPATSIRSWRWRRTP